jgi:hypothetical protein
MKILIASRTNGWIFGVALCCAFPAAHGATSADGCLDLGSVDNMGWTASVRAPGRYCLTQDLKQAAPVRWLRMAHQPVVHDPLLLIRHADSVSVDLMGHRLESNYAYNQGIFHVNGGGRVDDRPDAEKPPHRDIKVYNGTVRTSVQPAAVMVYAWNEENRKFFGRPFGKDELRATVLADSHGDTARYRETAYVLENLTLQSDGPAIVMQGKTNIIRHCKIIGGNSTVNVYGPNLIFEDNEIIMTAQEGDQPGALPATALYLEDGRDSIVRNNRIVIRGGAAGSVGIMLKNSANVVLEGNTVTGASAAFQLLDEQSGVVRLDAARLP